MNWLEVKAKGKTGELLIYGDITAEKWYEEDVTPLEIDKQINTLSDCTQIDVRINAYGGSVSAGLAIVAMLHRIKATTTAYIDGIGASMGSVIPMACDKVVMAENAMLMVHKPLTIAMGNAEDFKKEIEILDKHEEQLINIYMKRFKGTEEEIRDMLANETWLDAQDALEVGLCDEIEETVPMVASAKGIDVNGLLIPKQNELYDRVKKNRKIETVPDTEREVEKVTAGNKAVKEERIDRKMEFAKELNKICDFTFDEKDDVKAIVDKFVKSYKATIEKQYENYAEYKDKAKFYDKYKEDVIEEALSNGVRADGEKFNREIWDKAFKVLDISEIKEMSNSWNERAKEELNAGKKISKHEECKSFEIPDEAYKA